MMGERGASKGKGRLRLDELGSFNEGQRGREQGGARRKGASQGNQARR